MSSFLTQGPLINAMKDDIHPKQLRAARGLLNWSRGDLGAAAKTAERTIARLEDGESIPRASTGDAIRKAFEKAGVIFIPENGGGGGGGRTEGGERGPGTSRKVL